MDAGVGVLDRCLTGAARGVTDEDRAGLGGGLHADGGVDEVAGDHSLPVGVKRDRGLAGEHARASAQAGHAGTLAERRHGVDELEGRADGTLGVVLLEAWTPHTAMTASPMNFSTVPP